MEFDFICGGVWGFKTLHLWSPNQLSATPHPCHISNRDEQIANSQKLFEPVEIRFTSVTGSAQHL